MRRGRERPRQAQRRIGVSQHPMPVATVFENLEDLSIAEVMEQFDVTREQIEAVLEFVARSLRLPAPMPPLPDVDPV